MKPLRKYDITVARKDTKTDKSFYDKVGEIVVWPTDEGGERLQTRLFMFPDLNLATFLQREREDRPEGVAPVATDEIDISNLPF